MKDTGVLYISIQGNAIGAVIKFDVFDMQVDVLLCVKMYSKYTLNKVSSRNRTKIMIQTRLTLCIRTRIISISNYRNSLKNILVKKN